MTINERWALEGAEFNIKPQNKKGTVAKTFDEVLKFNPYHDSKGRFASANSAATFTYSPGKSKAHDLAIAREKDRMMRKDFSDRINVLTGYKDMCDPKNCILVGKEVAAEIDRRFKMKKKSGETEYDEPQTEDIYDVLKDIREFGPGEYADKIKVGSDIEESRTKAIMDNALDRFPTDWYAETFTDCGVMINDSHGRARHFVGYDGRSEIQVYTKESPAIVKDLGLKNDVIPNKGIENIVVHELGHYFERANWSVGDAARQFYEQRTRNSAISEMAPGEYTKKDRFADEYMGKVYSSGSTEITSVLTQKLGSYNPKESITSELYGQKRKDVQSYNFILGLLSGGGDR